MGSRSTNFRSPGGNPGSNWYDPVFARAAETFGLTPYSFGGDRVEGRSNGPWDCVGFVMECLDAANPPLGNFGLGIAQGFINAERARQACQPISEAEAQKGDLVFFKGTYDTPGASHIGIVWDPAGHIMADDHERSDGTGPGLTNWDEPYWRSHLMSFARVPRPFDSGLRPIINSEGEDISGMLKAAANAAGIPLELALACAIAESSLNPKAARYGAWPDISFGYGQQIVLYHYLGDRSNTSANIAAVRDAVFADPQGNLNDMCLRLKSDLQRVQGVDLSPVGGDQMLAALVVYNSGGWHKAADPWWGEWAENVKNYRRALTQSREMLA